MLGKSSSRPQLWCVSCPLASTLYYNNYFNFCSYCYVARFGVLITVFSRFKPF